MMAFLLILIIKYSNILMPNCPNHMSHVTCGLGTLDTVVWTGLSQLTLWQSQPHY